MADPAPTVFPRNQHGYTLYIVMIILIIAAILFSISIAEIHTVRIFSVKEVQKVQAKLLAGSGIVRTEYFLNGGDGHSATWETPGYEEKIGDFGTINLTVEQFGLFSRVASTGKRWTTSFTVEGLFGRNVPPPLEPALTLTDHVGGLILHRGSIVEGAVVLHHGYVYARKKGEPLSDYTRRLELRESPPLPFDTLGLPAIFERLAQRKAALLQSGPSIGGTLTLREENDSLLARKALVVKGDCRIQTTRCSNATIVVSGVCTISPGAVMNATTCFADKIICEGGTTGASLLFSEKTIAIAGGNHNSQFLAMDSIIISKTVSFGKMTVIAGCRNEFTKDSLKIAGGGVYCDDNAKIRGTIISFAAPQINRNVMSPSIILGKGTQIHGSIITDGDCYLYECDITGRLWAQSIVAKDEKGSYTDYLISSTIKKADEELLFPLLGEIPMRIAFTPSRTPALAGAGKRGDGDR